MNIHEKINELIPYVSENFITYPLFEEGKYIPFVNIWKIFKTDKEKNIFIKKLKVIHKNTGYSYYIEQNWTEPIIHEIQLYPKYKEYKKAGYKFIQENWSIEEILDLLIETLK